MPQRMTHDERHTQLLDLAEELFCSRGYDGVSIEDVARAAGVSRPVIYQHYGSKEGLFLACVQRARDDFQDDLEAAEAGARGDLEGFVQAGGELLFTLLHDHPSRWALLFSSSVGESGHLAQELTRLRFATIDRLAVMAGRYAEGVDEETLRAFAVAVSGISEAFGRWSSFEPTLSRERAEGYFRSFVTGSIRAALDSPRR